MDEQTVKIITVARYLGVAPWELELRPQWIEPAWEMMWKERSAEYTGFPIMIDGETLIRTLVKDHRKVGY